MKRLIFSLLFLVLVVSVQGQIGRYPFYITPPAAEESGDGNLLSNGTFDSSTGWTLGSGWSITGGQLIWDHTSAETVASQSPENMISEIVASTDYILEFDLYYHNYNSEFPYIYISFGCAVDCGGTYIVQTQFLDGIPEGDHITIGFTSPSWAPDWGFGIYAPALWKGDGFIIDNIKIYLDE